MALSSNMRACPIRPLYERAVDYLNSAPNLKSANGVGIAHTDCKGYICDQVDP